MGIDIITWQARSKWSDQSGHGLINIFNIDCFVWLNIVAIIASWFYSFCLSVLVIQ